MCEAEKKKDLYAVLGADPTDSHQRLKHRYQQLALQYHPDRLGSDASSEKSDKFLEVDAAWKILSDRDTRRQYDLERRAQELKQDWPEDSTVCLEDMTWDQDEAAYSLCCRCGGRFVISEDEVQEETGRFDEEETAAGRRTGAVVCCDTCSLSVYVTWLKTSKG